MNALARISSRTLNPRKAAGLAVAVTGAGLLAHMGLVGAVAIPAAVAAGAALLLTLLLMLASATFMARTAPRVQPVPVPVRPAQPWR